MVAGIHLHDLTPFRLFHATVVMEIWVISGTLYASKLLKLSVLNACKRSESDLAFQRSHC